VTLDFLFVSGASPNFNLQEFFKTLACQIPSLRAINLVHLRSTDDDWRGLAGIPGFEGFANEGLPKLLSLLYLDAFSLGLSGAEADGRRQLLSFESLDEEDYWVDTEVFKDLFDIFPTPKVSNARGRTLSVSRAFFFFFFSTSLYIFLTDI